MVEFSRPHMIVDDLVYWKRDKLIAYASVSRLVSHSIPLSLPIGGGHVIELKLHFLLNEYEKGINDLDIMKLWKVDIAYDDEDKLKHVTTEDNIKKMLGDKILLPNFCSLLSKDFEFYGQDDAIDILWNGDKKLGRNGIVERFKHRNERDKENHPIPVVACGTGKSRFLNEIAVNSITREQFFATMKISVTHSVIWPSSTPPMEMVPLLIKLINILVQRDLVNFIGGTMLDLRGIFFIPIIGDVGRHVSSWRSFLPKYLKFVDYDIGIQMMTKWIIDDDEMETNDGELDIDDDKMDTDDKMDYKTFDSYTKLDQPVADDNNLYQVQFAFG
ncbi:hypothetical protein C1646_745034 [Rhizophagus diaphanus]|nr:hypothetical protein C1646_745034 [Rhizophagus diaphanus] [Rhizophagus sp. MUCL 43196]